MKALLILLASALTLIGASTNRIFLTFDLSSDYDTNTFFHFYSSTNVALPVSEWMHATNVDFATFTNAMKVEIPSATGQRLFYVVTASNLFGESPFSAAVSVILPVPPRLRIGAY